MSSSSETVRFAALFVVMLLGACAKNTPGDRPAAKVNGTEISVSELRIALARAGAAAPGSPQPVTRQVVDGLIDQELLAQRALKAKLDKHPGVMQALEASRKQILAQAYLEQAADRDERQLAKQVSAFYAENRASFGERRLYRLFELGIIAPRESLGAIRTKAAHAKSINELVEWLKSRKLPFNVGGTAKFSEQIPREILARLAEMAEGQIEVVDVPGGVSVIQLLQSQQAPLTEEQAAPMIERIVAARNRLHSASQEIRKLRDGALIEYADLGGDDPKQPQAAAAPAATSGP